MNGEHPLAAGRSTVTSTCGFHAEHLKHPRAWLGTQHRRAGRHTDPKRTGAPCTVPHPGVQAGPSPGPGSPHRQPSNCWRDEPSEETTEEVVVSGPRRHPPGLAPGRCVGTHSAHRPPPPPGGFLVGPASRAPEGHGSLEQEEALVLPRLLWVPVSVTCSDSAFQ